MENSKISSFRGEYAFLSNFYEAPIEYDGICYRSNEAAFQAQKCADKADRERFANLNPTEAKHLGRKVSLRSDWEQVKIQVMSDIVHAKFEQNPELAEKLLATGHTYLEEGNTWGDRIWGTVNGVGANNLGRILMQTREDLMREIQQTHPNEYDGLVIITGSNASGKTEALKVLSERLRGTSKPSAEQSYIHGVAMDEPDLGLDNQHILQLANELVEMLAKSDTPILLATKNVVLIRAIECYASSHECLDRLNVYDMDDAEVPYDIDTVPNLMYQEYGLTSLYEKMTSVYDTLDAVIKSPPEKKSSDKSEPELPF